MKKQIVAGALSALLGWGGAGAAQEPRPFPLDARTPGAPTTAAPAGGAANQRMANAIALYLRASGQFKGCNLDIAFVDGVADLSGQVNDFAQRAEAQRIVRMIPGVYAVRDRLAVGSMPPQAAFMPAPMPYPPFSAMPMNPGLIPVQAVGPAIGPVPKELPPDGPGKGLPEPLSIMPMPTMPNPAYNPPPMPPYAWPTYAPYNNVSRVAYPKEYPYEAFPFIGPMYPFPKVPPGWRSVTLQWQDGYWWYSRKATGHDWWRVRYW